MEFGFYEEVLLCGDAKVPVGGMGQGSFEVSEEVGRKLIIRFHA